VQVSQTPSRVAIVQRSLRRYRAGFYDRVRNELARDGIELQVFHSTSPTHQDALELSWARRLEPRSLGFGRRGLLWQPLTSELGAADLVIVEQASRLLLNYRLLLRQILGGPAVAFWGHGRSADPGHSTAGEWIKRTTSRKVHWWFAYTSRSADILAALGFPAERVTVVGNAIDTAGLRREIEAVGAAGRESFRRELGLGAGPVGLFLGAFKADKRLDVLLEAAESIRAGEPSFQLVVVGRGALEDVVKTAIQRLPWVSYPGPLYGRDRAAMFAVADLLLIPGAVGLAVLESFAAGAPLITSSTAGHGPEIAYLRDRENGMVVAGGEDPHLYAAAVIEILRDRDLLARLQAGCAADTDRYTIDDMASNFAEGVRGALASTGNRRFRGRCRDPGRIL
jgi:glycosyltransferase involved in cell wall biosynthesis